MKDNIPTLNNPSELDKHHFGDTEWKPHFASFSHLFHINRVEDIKDKINFPIPPHRKTVYDFLFLTEGNSQRSKGLQEYNFSKNTFFFLPAFQISTHQFLSEDVKGFFCHFDAEIFNETFQNHHIFDYFPFLRFLGEPIIEVNEASKSFIINILERLEVEYAKNNLEKFDIVASYLFTLFTEVNQFVKVADFTKKNAALRITENYKNSLSQHIYTKQRISNYADLLAISPDHLNKSVKTTTGKSAQDLLNEMLLLEAKVMLRQTNLSISEVAFKLSERNPSDFSRFFKNKTGFTPKQYKQMPDIA
jgi:AraC family transcriptional regulator, transcriptional activator of pobA